MRDFAELLGAARARAAAGRLRLAVVGADSASALGAALWAAREGLVRPVLLGEEERIRALAAELGLDVSGAGWAPAAPERLAACAAALAGAGEVDVLLKGSLRTDELLHAVLARRHGLRTGRLLSDVLLYEDVLSGERRLVGVTDGGINPAPDAVALKQIVANAVEVLHALGCARPRVALLSATEVVSDALPSTRMARTLVEEAATGALGDCELEGPLALDGALVASAAAAKGLTGPVAGRADVLVVPGVEAGNILGKSAKYLAGSITAHVAVGARVPVLLPSRVESELDKLHSIALGVLLGPTPQEWTA